MGFFSKLFRKKQSSASQLEPLNETPSSPTPAPTPEKATQVPTQSPVQTPVHPPTQPTPRIFMGEFDLLEGYRLVYQRSGNKYGFSRCINACLYKGDEFVTPFHVKKD